MSTRLTTEQQATLTNNWITDLSHFGMIQVKGSNAANFLQGQLTCDVNDVNEQSVSLGAYCDHKGRMLATFRIWLYDSDYYLLLPQRMVQTIVEHLRKYAAFSRVNVNTVDPERWRVLEYAGENKPAHDVHGIVLQIPQPKIMHAYHSLIITKDKQFDINATPIGPSLSHAFNVKYGLVHIQPQTSGLFTPQMVNLQLLGGVSFKKGCYVGQEIIARTENLGKLKRHLYRATMNCNEIPTIGDAVTNADSQPIGIIVAAAAGFESNFQLLAVMQDQALAQSNNEAFYNNAKLVPERVRVC